MDQSSAGSEPEQHFELRLPVHADSVAIGRRAAAQFAEEAGFDERERWAVRLATSEAISNVVLHAHVTPEDRGYFELLAQSDASEVRICVTDHGGGMRTRTDSPGMGHGMALMDRVSDELVVGAGQDGGVVVCLTFNR